MKLGFTIIYLLLISYSALANDNEPTKKKKIFNNKHQGLAFGISAGKYIYGDVAYYKTKYLVLTTLKQSYGIEFGRYNNQTVLAPKASLHLKFLKYVQVGEQVLFYYDFNQVAPALRTEVGYVINRQFEARAAVYTYVWNNDLTSHLNKYHISILYFLKIK
ncbi:MAG: hypothetical protein SGJ10_08545 [Bacteroidota bacterium]|nr:hypothetical protein [Bacteroidota bacterium]